MTMKRKIITISDSGMVTVPSEVRMSISEIADLFGIYYQTAKRLIRKIEKVEIITGDYTDSCTLEGKKIHPECYKLEMIVAVAFQIQSEKAKMFRDYLLRKFSKTEIPDMLIITNQNPKLN